MGTRTPVFAVRGRRLNRLTMEACLAAEPGFEPGLNESESFVLPLHNSAPSTEHDSYPIDVYDYIATREESQAKNEILYGFYLIRRHSERAQIKFVRMTNNACIIW